MTAPAALPAGLRRLTQVTGALFLLTGLPFFFAPGWSAERFPWTVSVFVAMTIGAWCLGNAAIAFQAARRWSWPHVRGILTYLWIFSFLELAVVVVFADKLVLDSVLTYPYLAALATGFAGAAWGAVHVSGTRPEAEAGPPQPRWVRTGWVVFALFVLFLASVALLRPGAGTSQRIFPEVLSRFTISAFGTFYLSLALATIPVIRARTTGPTHGYLRGGLWLLVFITVATAFHWQLFDVPAHPGHAVYPGVYVAALVVDLIAIRVVPSGP